MAERFEWAFIVYLSFPRLSDSVATGPWDMFMFCSQKCCKNKKIFNKIDDRRRYNLWERNGWQNRRIKHYLQFGIPLYNLNFVSFYFLTHNQTFDFPKVSMLRLWNTKTSASLYGMLVGKIKYVLFGDTTSRTLKVSKNMAKKHVYAI